MFSLTSADNATGKEAGEAPKSAPLIREICTEVNDGEVGSLAGRNDHRNGMAAPEVSLQWTDH